MSRALIFCTSPYQKAQFSGSALKVEMLPGAQFHSGDWGENTALREAASGTLRGRECSWQMSSECDVDATAQQAGGSNLVLSPANRNYI